jgi:hypothetical protein
MAAPFLDDIRVEVIHVVRNPFDVVGSLVGRFFNLFTENHPVDLEFNPLHFQYEKFIYKNLPELTNEETQLDRGCLYYIRWNQMIESSNRVSLFHRIEDPADKIKNFFHFQGLHYNNSKCNTTNQFSLKWTISQIKNPKIKKEMIDVIRKYGYSNLAEIKIF